MDRILTFKPFWNWMKKIILELEVDAKLNDNNDAAAAQA